MKEYVRFETKPKVNCVRDALVKKILAIPPVEQCCEGGWNKYAKMDLDMLIMIILKIVMEFII